MNPQSKEPSFKKSAFLNVVTLAAVLAAAAVVPRQAGSSPTLVNRMISKFNSARTVTITREQAGREIEGYYEGLFQQSSRTAGVSALVAGQWAANWNAGEFTRLRNETTRRRGDFLYFELVPNLNVSENTGRLVTNSFGMADREYTRERRPGFRRVAFIGDSMARGMGSNPGANYESLLENFLNERRPVGGPQGYELLNFGVEGYRITQMVEVVRTRAADFSPDCYVIVLSQIGVVNRWSDHLWQLVNSGIDLRYDFLKDVAERAGVHRGDDAATTESKLGPYRMAILRWALEAIRDYAKERNAVTLVLLVPTVSDPGVYPDWFRGIPELLGALEIPAVDLLDTFNGIDDLTPFRISTINIHPSDLGHKRLFEHMLAKLETKPAAWRTLTGTADYSFLSGQ